VRLSAGPAVEAVLAAAAIPGLLPPVRLGGRVLADGGVPAPPRSAPDAAVNALTGIFGARLEGDLVRYATAAELIVLPAANPRHVLPTNFSHARELIALSLAAARTVLAARDSAPGAARASFSGRAA